MDNKNDNHQTPRVFLSYSHADKELAHSLAEELQSNGIDTFLDDWCILDGDSIVQTINKGIADCTHFLVLLTPNSIDRPWVKAETDAGLIRKIKDKCRFIPVRHALPADKLPPLLQGLRSPEIKSASDVKQLMSTIHGVSKKPPLGQPPASVLQAREVKTGYSAAATAMARAFVEKSEKIGTAIDVMLSVDEIMKETGLTIEDIEDAYNGLKDEGFLKRGGNYIGWKISDPRSHVSASPSLFEEFNRFFTEWDTEEDVKRIAVDMLNNNDFPTAPKAIADHYGWEMRRTEPAISLLGDRSLAKIHTAIGTGIGFCVDPNRSSLRRFVREMEQ